MLRRALAVIVVAIFLLSAQVVFGQFMLEWKVAGVGWYMGDMDGDGIGELAACDLPDGVITEFYDCSTHNVKWTATGSIRQGIISAVWYPSTYPPLIDYNGDGVTDVTLRPASPGDGNYLIVDVVTDSVIFGLSDPIYSHWLFRALADVDDDSELELVISAVDPSLACETTYVYGTGVSTMALEGSGASSVPVHTLNQNFPNPFRGQTTTIEYSVQRDCPISIKIYNSAGQQIRTLVDEHKKMGDYIARWDGRDGRGNRVADGIYFYQMQAGQYTSAKKAVLLR